MIGCSHLRLWCDIFTACSKKIRERFLVFLRGSRHRLRKNASRPLASKPLAKYIGAKDNVNGIGMLSRWRTASKCNVTSRTRTGGQQQESIFCKETGQRARNVAADYENTLAMIYS